MSTTRVLVYCGYGVALQGRSSVQTDIMWHLEIYYCRYKNGCEELTAPYTADFFE